MGLCLQLQRWDDSDLWAKFSCRSTRLLQTCRRKSCSPLAGTCETPETSSTLVAMES